MLDSTAIVHVLPQFETVITALEKRLRQQELSAVDQAALADAMIMAHRNLRLREVQELVPYSKVHINRLEKAGDFPRRIRLTPGRVVWPLIEIIAWVAERRAMQLPPISDQFPSAKIASVAVRPRRGRRLKNRGTTATATTST